MGKEGGPSGDEGSRDGLTQGFWALAGSGMGELAEEPCSFCAPTASSFNSKNDQAAAAATWLDKFWVGPFFGPSRIPECRAGVLSSVLSGCSLAGEGGNNGGVDGQLASSPKR